MSQKRTYYNKLKSVREIQIEKSQTILTKIADENYNNLKEQLLELEKEKRKLKEKFLIQLFKIYTVWYINFKEF